MRAAALLALTVAGCGHDSLSTVEDMGPDFAAPDLAPAPTCSDGAKNGAETDVDCGGTACPGCDLGRACFLGRDCLSGNCVNNTCRPPAC